MYAGTLGIAGVECPQAQAHDHLITQARTEERWEKIKKARKPGDLKERIENAKKGIFDEEDQEGEEEEE